MLIQQAVNAESATKKMPLGTRYFDEKTGKVWRYVKANEALVLGDIVTPLLQEFNGDCDAVAAGAKTFLDAAVTFTAGLVDSYIKINANSANINQKPNRITAFVDANNLKVEDAWVAALTTSEDYEIFNPYKIELVDAASELITGVTQIAVTSGYYFWMQVDGYCDHVRVKADGNAVAVHQRIIASGTAGQGMGKTAANAGDTYNTANLDLISLEASQAGIFALVSTALADQTIPCMLRSLS